MATEKKAMNVVFKMNKKLTTDEWRKMFSGAYKIIFDLPGLFSKTWWVNQEKNEWGAFYVFDSEKDLQSYITSDLWVNKIPAKYETKAEITILEVGSIIAKKAVTEPELSWMTK